MKNGKKSYVGLPILERVSGRGFYNKKLNNKCPNITRCSKRNLQSDSVVKIHKTISPSIDITSLMTLPIAVWPDNKPKSLTYES